MGQGNSGLQGPGRAAGVDGGDARGLETGREGFGSRFALGRERLESVEIAVGRPDVELLGMADEIDVLQGRGGQGQEDQQKERQGPAKVALNSIGNHGVLL